MEVEGTFDILRLNRPDDPEPWTYRAPFTFPGRSGAPAHRLVGDDAVRHLLQGAGVHKEAIEAVLSDARAGRGVVPHVRLTPERIRALGI